MIVAKGSALRATLGFIETSAGADALAAVLAGLPADVRTQVERVTATDEIPFSLLRALWHAADQVMAPIDPLWMEKAGAHSISSVGAQLYGGIIKKGSPLEFLTQPIKLFRLYYHGGDMQIVEQEAERAVLRMVDFDEPDTLFCRRQTGGLKTAVELAGGRNAVVRHVRCANEGDAFCEWELSWTV